MASAKQFLGNRTMGNAKVAAQLKGNPVVKILEIEVKEAPVSKEEVLAVKVKGCDGWIRVNPTNLQKWITAWGDDTDNYVGKSFKLVSFQSEVMGKMQTQFTMDPVKG